MLATPKRLQTSSSIPFIPRQVIMLETESAAAPAAAQPVEGKKRRKEKSIDEKKKKKKRSAETLENGSAAPSRSLELVRCGSSAVEGKRREALLGSIAAFLESNGFSKTLAVFRSEAQIETDVSKTSIMNLEDLFFKFLESSKATIDWLKEEEKEKLDIPENDKGLNTLDGSEHSQKKKRKHRSEKDDGMKDELHKTELSSEGCSVENSEKKSKEFEASCDGTDIKSSVSAESLHVDSKGKKKKKKSSAGSITEEKSHQEDNHGIENSDQQLLVKEEKLKKKSKKHNPSVGSETNAIEQKVKEQKSLTNGSTPSVESNPNHKDEKKKKRKKSSDSLAEDTAKLEGDDVDKKTGTLEIPDKPESETLAVSKKKKTKRSSEDSALPATGSLSEQLTNGECNSQKEETPGFSLGNGSIDKKGREINTSSAKKEKHSAEPKTAFQRVKAEEVEFADERLQDNSYWAKDGADIGYGAKAQEILGQVRGRDFRHEKTKKKRGSYRGGQIDLQSHSIKFNYSDEE